MWISVTAASSESITSATGMVGGVGAPQRLPDVEVRLHAPPLPRVVIVRVAGTVAGPGVGLMAERVAQQLGRAAHVVLDLGEERVLDTDGVNVVLDLHRQRSPAVCACTLAGADHEAVSAPLRLTGVVDELPDLAPCADAVVARLRRPDPTGGPTGVGISGVAVIAGVAVIGRGPGDARPRAPCASSR